MAHAAYLREKARRLRFEKKLTIDELSDRLCLPRTTVYHWVLDLPLETRRSSGWPRSAQALGSRAMQKKYRLLREAAYAEGRDSFERLAEDPLFRDFVCLYIAEGYKRTRHSVSLANSDPAVIRVANSWLKRMTTRAVSYHVQYHADQNLAELRRFWAGVVGAAPEDIRLLRKSNSNQLAKRNWRSAHGVLTVCTNDTLFRARLQGWMDRIREDWA
jgi:hypothetical protein